MADRYGFQFTKSIVPEVWIVDGYFPVLETGSGSLVGDALPIWLSSVVHNSTGNYTFTLDDLWVSIGFIGVQVISDNDATDTTIAKVVTYQPGSVSGTTVTTASFVVQCINCTTGAAVDPEAGGGLQVSLHLHNSNSV